MRNRKVVNPTPYVAECWKMLDICKNSEHALPANQMLAAQMLATGQSPADVAAAIGIHRETLYRWRRNPLFINEMAACRAECFAAHGARLQQLLDSAIDAIAYGIDHNRLNEIRIPTALGLLKLIGAARLFGAAPKPPCAPPTPASALLPPQARPDSAAGDA